MKIATALIAALVITLGICAMHHPAETESYWPWMSTKVDDGQILQSPEMKARVAEINAQIPLVTVSSWDAKKVRKASDYFAKIR